MRLPAYLNFAVDELLRGDLSYLTRSVDYDTAWAARLTNEDGALAYPSLLGELAKRQHEDGSWGSQIPYIHDRLLSTLAVVLLLRRFGSRQMDRERMQAGVRYIWQNAGKLHHDVHPTVGFEMILPTLLKEGKALGLRLPYDQLRPYERERERKLSFLPMERLFRTRTTALWSLEAFAGDVNVADAADLRFADGSMVGCPSATAFLMDQAPDWRARFPESAAHLESLMSQGEVGLPIMSSCGVFMRAWVLYYLYHGDLLSENKDSARAHCEYLRENLGPDGVGFTPEAFPDSDDTSVTLFALHKAGYEVDGRCLLDFERDDHFAVFSHEIQPSISANLHVLEALETLPESDQPRVRQKIVSYILGERQPGGYWGDKWHASVYYPTSKVLTALLPHAPEEMDETLNWLVSTQHPDGSWGQYMSTSEETALALLPSLLYYRSGWSVAGEPMHNAARYLLENERPFDDDYPELWTSKTLYTPTPVVRSIILAALSLYERTFGIRKIS